MCEFMWLAKSYSDASTAPLKVCTHSVMFSPLLEERFSLFAIRFSLAALQLCHPERRVRALRRPGEESKDPYSAHPLLFFNSRLGRTCRFLITLHRRDKVCHFLQCRFRLIAVR